MSSPLLCNKAEKEVTNLNAILILKLCQLHNTLKRKYKNKSPEGKKSSSYFPPTNDIQKDTEKVNQKQTCNVDCYFAMK